MERALRDALVQTLSPNPAVIKQAEAALKAAAVQPGYSVALLQLVSTDAPVELRQAAAVNFKNHTPQEDDAGVMPPAVPDDEKARVKASLMGVLLAAPPVVRAQLSEALVIIGDADFPANWPELLPDLVGRLAGATPAVADGVLGAANAVFKRYRGQFMTQALSTELEYSQAMVEPLLAALQGALERAAAARDDERACRLALSSARLACRIFFSLNAPGLTEQFEAALPGYMAAFHAALTLDAPACAATSPDDEGADDALRAAVCANINLFLEMNEEEFAPYLPAFARDVWALLVATPQAPGKDGLAMAATRFLTTVAKSVHAPLFAADGALQQVCEAVVVPSIMLRPDLEELFEFHWLEYVRRDAEGGDADTRRRAATELVRALAAQFPAEVTGLLSGVVGRMLGEAGANPKAAWRSLDAALYLVSALAARTRTAAAGATATNELVDVPDFFARHVAPQLAERAAAAGGGAGGAGPNAAAGIGPDVLAADALKFTTLFRSALPDAGLAAAVPHAIALLAVPANVVHTYAAILIERLLAPRPGGAGPRLGSEALTSHLSPLLDRLFAAFRHPESAENEYLMKCVTRVVAAAGPAIAPAAPAALAQLAAMLLEAAKNPSHPGFNHWLFEAVACLVGMGAAAGDAAVAALEAALFPALTVVLQNDVQEFHPYTFQVLAQLVEARPGAPPAPYLALLPPLLAPAFWERRGNVPALARLLRALLLRAGDRVAASGQLEAVLGVLQKLVSTRAADADSMRLALALLRGVPAESLAPYLPALWSLLFRRLQAARTPRFAAGLVLFCAGFAALVGAPELAASVDGVQPGLFSGALVRQVWAPGLVSAATGAPPADAKLLAVGTGRVLADVPALRAPDASQAWGALLVSAVAAAGLAAGGAGGAAPALAGPPLQAAPDADADADGAGYSVAHSALTYAAPPADDPLPGVLSPGAGLAAELARGAAAAPGTFGPIVAATLPADAQAGLQALLGAAGVTLV